MTGILAAPWPGQVALATLAVALAISVATDLRSRLILHVVTFPALVVILGCTALGGGPSLLWNAGLGLAVCAVPVALGALRGAMGWGDVTLMAVAGSAAGWPSALAVLAFVSVAGGLQAGAAIALARMRRRPPPASVPYGVAIAAGTLAAFLWGDALLLW